MSILEITVQELAVCLQGDRQDLQLIDVREHEEVEIAAIADFVILPLSEYDQWSINFKQRFDVHAQTLVLCHHEMRSAQMCHWLVSQGFTDVKNIRGGIDAYAHAIDPTMSKY
jgi:rhodanese-related sulfurtransferase